MKTLNDCTKLLAKTTLLVLGAALAAGCASTTPPELLKARTAYDRAAEGPAVQLAPADLHYAQEALNIAEKSFQENGDSTTTRDTAYTAERKAELADVRARTAAAAQARTQTLAQLQALKDQQVQLTSAALSDANQQLANEDSQLRVERHRREEAERRAAMAAADLARIASVKQEPRGMVITLSGAVLFESAKSDLLSTAQAKLSEVAEALTKQDVDSKIRVEGFTDSQGGVAFNQELSQRRASTVRSFLVAHGIAADRITAEGFGLSNPIADNTSPEGRANNRRVEIVVEPAGRVGTVGQ